VAEGDIIIRHLIVEEYIAIRTPTTTLSVSIPSDFIYDTFINNTTAHNLAVTHWLSQYFGIPFFVQLRQTLVEERNGIDCDWWQPWDWLDCGKRAYLDAWIDDIDSGLRAWPYYMGQISIEFFLNDYDGHFDVGMQIFENFAYRHLLSMYGSPDFVGDFLENWDDLTEWIEGLIDIDIPSFSDLVIYLIEWIFGFSFDELKDYVTELANYIDVPPLFETDTSERLDALMHVTSYGDEVYFDPQQFAANWNTILVAKMVLLDPDALNQILIDYDVGPLYGGANNLVPFGMWENAMLGFIHSLDGNHQWRKVTIDDPSIQHSEGMPLWIDCQAREHVFRVLFTDWEYDNFPNFGDDCECWNDLPPVITVDLNRDVLWPPNHKMVDIIATVTVEDDCDENPTFVLTSITSNEPDEGLGDGDHPFDIQGASFGSADTEFQLRAERSGIGEGRIYSITYTASDYAGNTSDALVTVRVPHDNQGRAIASNGFNTSGMGFDPQHDTFVLIIPTIPETAGIPVENTFIATSVNAENTFVGNTSGAIRPLKSWLCDSDVDGFEDLALLYSVTSVIDIMLNSDEIDGPIGLHFHTMDQTNYLVPDIFGLGAPIFIDLPVTAVGDQREDAPDYDLPELTSVKAYPNPFNPYTTVTFSLATDSSVNLAIYDAKGALVRSLATGHQSAGRYQLTWDGRDNDGRSVGSGVYLLRFLAGDFKDIQKLIMLK